MPRGGARRGHRRLITVLGAFYASIPSNRVDLNDGMDQAYRSLVVND
jgi:hypothetical protein